MPFFLFTEGLPSLIDLTQPSLYVSLISIAAGPILWNAIGRNEYKNKTITKLIGGRVAATILGVIIVLMGLLRDVLYRIALHDQPRYPLPYGIQTVLSWAIFGAANFLVLTSYLALGFYGTFVGDYFGILQPKRVTRFPFNIFKDPMYLGATWCYVGAALWYVVFFERRILLRDRTKGMSVRLVFWLLRTST
ncbi:phospholipid methyltransferase-domain-containing protein [Mycena sp. CBHHK59/15]|nr:phospholipid methyltransferase-domain-containing protein [Mycena sp. CBHHK59/15]